MKKSFIKKYCEDLKKKTKPKRKNEIMSRLISTCGWALAFGALAACDLHNQKLQRASPNYPPQPAVSTAAEALTGSTSPFGQPTVKVALAGLWVRIFFTHLILLLLTSSFFSLSLSPYFQTIISLLKPNGPIIIIINIISLIIIRPREEEEGGWEKGGGDGRRRRGLFPKPLRASPSAKGRVWWSPNTLADTECIIKVKVSFKEEEEKRS